MGTVRDLQPFGGSTCFSHCAVDVQLVAAEVDIGPLQDGHLAAPQPGIARREKCDHGAVTGSRRPEPCEWCKIDR
jgi:hypothetical protein